MAWGSKRQSRRLVSEIALVVRDPEARKGNAPNRRATPGNTIQFSIPEDSPNHWAGEGFTILVASASQMGTITNDGNNTAVTAVIRSLPARRDRYALIAPNMGSAMSQRRYRFGDSPA